MASHNGNDGSHPTRKDDDVYGDDDDSPLTRGVFFVNISFISGLLFFLLA